MRVSRAQNFKQSSSRRAHILRENAGTAFPRFIIFFDTETREIPGEKETELVLRLGHAILWRLDLKTKETFDFYTIKEFWDWVFSKLHGKMTFYFVAHNLPFDFKVMKGFTEMQARGMKPKKVISAGVRNVWSFRRDTSTLCFLDDMNFFNVPLKYLGHSIGLDKIELTPERMKVIPDPQLMVYCRRDVEIMVKAWELLIAFLKENNLGNFAATIASQAFNAYRHRFMTEKIFIHTREKVIKAERDSYHGGRTECFRLGEMPEQKYYLLDVNSMYPFVMRKFAYPIKYMHTWKSPAIKNLSEMTNKFCVIASVRLRMTEPVFPVAHNDKLIFPVGEFDTILTTREIEHARLDGNILKVHYAMLYGRKNLFRRYVDFFHGQKEKYERESNPAFRFMCKIFLNSLYGKFGQRNERWDEIDNPDFYEEGVHDILNIDDDSRSTERHLGGAVFRTTGEKFEGYHSFVAIPSHITADARMELWRYIKIAGRENVFYCDTDSVIVNQRGFDNLAPSCKEGVLGALSLKEITQHLELWGSKDYVFEKKSVIKGIRGDAVMISEGKFEQTRFEGFAGAMRKGHLNQQFIAPVVKTLARNYDKGVVLPSGLVDPIRLSGTGT